MTRNFAKELFAHRCDDLVEVTGSMVKALGDDLDDLSKRKLAVFVKRLNAFADRYRVCRGGDLSGR